MADCTRSAGCQCAECTSALGDLMVSGAAPKKKAPPRRQRGVDAGTSSTEAGLCSVGSRVTLGKRYGLGTVRFVGETCAGAGTWAGVELDGAEGKNDGTVLGIRYFVCPPNHGLLTRLQKLRPAQEPQKVEAAKGRARSAQLLQQRGHQGSRAGVRGGSAGGSRSGALPTASDFTEAALRPTEAGFMRVGAGAAGKHATDMTIEDLARAAANAGSHAAQLRARHTVASANAQGNDEWSRRRHMDVTAPPPPPGAAGRPVTTPQPTETGGPSPPPGLAALAKVLSPGTVVATPVQVRGGAAAGDRGVNFPVRRARTTALAHESGPDTSPPPLPPPGCSPTPMEPAVPGPESALEPTAHAIGGGALATPLPPPPPAAADRAEPARSEQTSAPRLPLDYTPPPPPTGLSPALLSQGFTPPPITSPWIPGPPDQPPAASHGGGTTSTSQLPPRPLPPPPPTPAAAPPMMPSAAPPPPAS
jgi:dynactin 1